MSVDSAQILTGLDVTTATMMAEISAIKGDLMCLTAIAHSVRQTMQVIKDEASRIRMHVTLEHEQTRNVIVQGVADNRNSMITTMDKDKAETRQKEHQDRMRQTFLDHLRFSTMTARSDTIHDTYGNTFSWIFDVVTSDASDNIDDDVSDNTDDGASDNSDNNVSAEDRDSSGNAGFEKVECDFGEWLSTDMDDSIYWISGKAGSGKSSLMKLIANHPDARKLLKTWATPRRCLMITHYFWTAGTYEQKGLLGMLRSIL